ncbi:acyl-CoA dehydrogenase family protein, partial [Gordonia rhizosphera]
MHWELSDEQELFASSLREWIAAKFPTETVRELEASDGMSSFTDALISEGWWGVGYPEEAGGQGGGVLELALAAREFGRAAVPDSRWLAAALVSPLLSEDELAAQLSGE